MSIHEYPEPGQMVERMMAGYLGIETQQVPEQFNAGFSTYIAAWPLLDEYPDNRFQTGLFGTWMHPQYDGPVPEGRLYCDIEGGLGWWRDTRFATATPKFIMGGVALNFSAWANGPGAGKNRDWDNPLGLYGVAQLSPYVIWPPDGLNLAQGTCGELWGYGYLPLPLIEPTTTTADQPVATGGNCWTLFLNTGNFKGPVAFFTPYFFSGITAEKPELQGLFLDSRPAKPNRPHQMETQYVPCMQAATAQGDIYSRIAPTSFPRNSQGQSPVMHRITAYTKAALWDQVHDWLYDNGKPVAGQTNVDAAVTHEVGKENRASWSICKNGTKREDRVPIDWKTIANGHALDPHTFGYAWDQSLVTHTDTTHGPLVTLPEYYKLDEGPDGKPLWVPVAASDVPSETGLTDVRFTPAKREVLEPYETPTDPTSCWHTPGPVTEPTRIKLGDGSTVIYSWYRFADQPAILNADLTDDQREALQKRVEKLHAHWKRDGQYLPEPAFGDLAEIDPALVVTPPKGLEIGYVPIVTWQGIETQ